MHYLYAMQESLHFRETGTKLANHFSKHLCDVAKRENDKDATKPVVSQFNLPKPLHPQYENMQSFATPKEHSKL